MWRRRIEFRFGKFCLICLCLKNSYFFDRIIFAKIGMVLKIEGGITIAGTKFSRQRQCILDYLLNTKEHPTAEMVYLHVRQEYPHISLGTVYRNLNLLAEQKQIKKLYCGDGCERFDGDMKFHHHFICRHCGRILDLEMESFDHINTLANIHFPGRIEGHVTYFYGVCGECILSVQEEVTDPVESEKI